MLFVCLSTSKYSIHRSIHWIRFVEMASWTSFATAGNSQPFVYLGPNFFPFEWVIGAHILFGYYYISFEGDRSQSVELTWQCLSTPATRAYQLRGYVYFVRMSRSAYTPHTHTHSKSIRIEWFRNHSFSAIAVNKQTWRQLKDWFKLKAFSTPLFRNGTVCVVELFCSRGRKVVCLFRFILLEFFSGCSCNWCTYVYFIVENSKLEQTTKKKIGIDLGSVGGAVGTCW